jgi:hypothetical protein
VELSDSHINIDDKSANFAKVNIISLSYPKSLEEIVFLSEYKFKISTLSNNGRCPIGRAEIDLMRNKDIKYNNPVDERNEILITEHMCLKKDKDGAGSSEEKSVMCFDLSLKDAPEKMNCRQNKMLTFTTFRPPFSSNYADVIDAGLMDKTSEISDTVIARKQICPMK